MRPPFAFRTHIALEIVVLDIRLDPYEVPKHPRHQIFSENDNLLFEELDPTGVSGEVHIGYTIP